MVSCVHCWEFPTVSESRQDSLDLSEDAYRLHEMHVKEGGSKTLLPIDSPTPPQP